MLASKILRVKGEIIHDFLNEKYNCISLFVLINAFMTVRNYICKNLISVATRAPEAAVQTGIELGSECVEPRVPTLPNG